MRRARAAAVAVLLFLSAVPLFAQQRERSEIPEKYRWDLTPIFADEASWRAAKDQLATRIPQVASFKGTLGSSPKALADALTTLSDINKSFSRLFLYASLSGDQDVRVGKYQAMRQEMSALRANYAAAAAYVEPEILNLDRATIDRFIAEDARLAPYRFYLTDLTRRKEHTLTAAEEKIIADAGLMTGTASNAYGIFANAEFPYPTVKLSDGTTRKLDWAAFGAARALANREDRKAVFETFFGELGKYKGTFGSTLNGAIQRDLFYARARKYPTTVEAALDEDNIPVSVYTNLVSGVNANLPTFHRYLKLRQRMMGLDQLHYYDLYAPLVGSVKQEYSIEEARKMIVEGLAPLGADYTATLGRAFDERWLDIYPNAGKRSGAYMNATYDVHPYVLLNYNGQYNDVSTTAHELGHLMQSYLSNKTQPFPTASYPIFVAEVASTFNEALLIDHVLKETRDPATRLALLGNYLEGFKGTLFRQTQFAEFELRTHELAESGKPLTGETLDALYMEIAKKYYGHDKGVTVVDDVVKHEWAYIPHFYNGYYVYQYATSFTASAALSEKMLAGDKNAKQRMLTFLSAGGSKYPIELLRDAGVDMTTSEPLDLTIRQMNRIMDEMEKILAGMKK